MRSRSFFLFLVAVLTLLAVSHSRFLDERMEKTIREQIERDDASRAEQKAGLFEGDIQMDRNEQEAWTSGKLVPRDAVIMPGYHWPGGKLYYSFDESLNHYTIAMIQKAFKHIELHTCVTFHRYNNEPHQHYVVYFQGNGCYSRIGRDPRHFKQHISIGRGCERLGTIVHESMHALGFFHEHTRPDRDKFVSIKWAEIIRKNAHNFKKYPRALGTSLGKPYDYLSVMHYSRYAFAKDSMPTIVPTKLRAIIGQRYGLSHYDAYEINKLYKCDVGRCIDRSHPFVCNYFKHHKHGFCSMWYRHICKRTCGDCPSIKQKKKY